MRFMWQSNVGWSGTGYGTQTGMLLRELKNRGHEPSCFAFYGLEGNKIEYDGYTVYPKGFDAWGNDVIKLHLEDAKAEALVTLIDLFVLDPNIWASLPVPWVAWTPIDSLGIGDTTLQVLKIANVPVAMSNYGAEQMVANGVEPAAVIYHAVDTEIFKPMDKTECRAQLEIPDDMYLIGMVMANKGDRKQYPLQLTAVKKWMEQHPELNVRVFMHCDPTSAMGGWDMRQLVRIIGLEGKVFSTNQYRTSVIPAETELMAAIFNSFDVLLNCSSGEGFGIPIVEAQACGVPVITHGVTAMPEITINGYCVKSGSQGMGGHYAWQFQPDIDDMVYRLECVYRNFEQSDAVTGREWVIQNCALPVIADRWDELLRMVGTANDAQPKQEALVS